MDTHPTLSPQSQVSRQVDGLEYRWDLGIGSFAINAVPVVAFFRDSSLARILVGFLSTLGPQRFSLMMQAEGQRSTDEDWAIISAAADFPQGFAELSKYAHTAGWGRWEIVELDLAGRRARFRIHNSWEGAIQRAMGLSYGVGLVAGKFTSFCQRLFDCRCWPRQTRFIAEGDPFDELIVEPSTRSVEEELDKLADAGQATSTDLQQILAAREKALAERDRMVAELQDKLAIIAEQRLAIAALSTPIVQLWDEVLAVPIVGAIDGERTARLMEKLLDAILHNKARAAILDVTGVDAIDVDTADNLIRIIRAVKLLGAHGVLSGIGPMVAQTIVDLGVDLTSIETFSNLREALRACISAPGRRTRT